LGSSLVGSGLDPETFSTRYEAVTGEPMECFNFGLGSLMASAAGPIAQILVDPYHPKLLIYGTNPRDYDRSNNNQTQNQFLVLLGIRADYAVNKHPGESGILGRVEQGVNCFGVEMLCDRRIALQHLAKGHAILE
jgi:hypothetical protein